MITTAGIEAIRDFLKSHIKDGEITADGQTVKVELQDITIENNDTVKFYLYLNENIGTGTINRVRLYDVNDVVFIEKNDVVIKPAYKGLLYLFELQVKEV